MGLAGPLMAWCAHDFLACFSSAATYTLHRHNTCRRIVWSAHGSGRSLDGPWSPRLLSPDVEAVGYDL